MVSFHCLGVWEDFDTDISDSIFMISSCSGFSFSCMCISICTVVHKQVENVIFFDNFGSESHSCIQSELHVS